MSVEGAYWPQMPARQRWSGRRRRLFVLSLAVVVIAAVTMSVSFLATTGTVTVSIGTPNSTNFLYPVSSGGISNWSTTGTVAPTGAGTNITGLYFGSNGTTGKLPSWSVGTNQPGGVGTAGDLAVIDATIVPSGLSVIVNVYITNLAALQQAYTSFAFPINVYRCAAGGTAGTACGAGTQTTTTASANNWVQYSAAASATQAALLTNTQGFLSFALPSGYYYDLTMDSSAGGTSAGSGNANGGSFYCFNAAPPAGGSLNPTFYFTTQVT